MVYTVGKNAIILIYLMQCIICDNNREYNHSIVNNLLSQYLDQSDNRYRETSGKALEDICNCDSIEIVTSKVKEYCCLLPQQYHENVIKWFWKNAQLLKDIIFDFRTLYYGNMVNWLDSIDDVMEKTRYWTRDQRMNITLESFSCITTTDHKAFGLWGKGWEVRLLESKIRETEYVHIIWSRCGDTRMGILTPWFTMSL